ncbi:MAG: aldo/keto reductase [Arenimonas sp.]|nr:aldo/keto reductase [Arenimonas sp.]
MQSTANKELSAARLILGCWRIDALAERELCALLETALGAGIGFFDHADIYGQGRSESLFGAAMASLGVKREDIVIQSKCGIRNGFYDSSRKHLLDSVDGSLKRLNTDYLDVLLLHRPDALMEPDEISQAFSELLESGKVRHFGVSNFKPMQIEVLKQHLSMPLIANQLQFGLAHTGMLDTGVNANLSNDAAIDRNGDVLEYSQLQGMRIQAWSPLQFGFFEGNFIDHPGFPELNRVLNGLAETYDCTPAALAIAWILRHPAGMQAILGTSQPKRLLQLSKASAITLSREHWYALYRAAGNSLP